MYHPHVFGTGATKLICQLSDKDLRAAINEIIDYVSQCKGQVSNKVVFDEFESSLYGVEPKDVRARSRNGVQNGTKRLYPYLAEAALRGMSFKQKLQKLYNRKGADGGLFAKDEAKRIGSGTNAQQWIDTYAEDVE